MLDFPQQIRASAKRRWRQLAVAVAAASVAALATGASASADTPTDPPPVTVLTHGNSGEGDFFVTPAVFLRFAGAASASVVEKHTRGDVDGLGELEGVKHA